MDRLEVHGGIMPGMDRETESYKAFQYARTQHNAYFEKLALLDGATVALVVTAVLGPLHAQVKHRYLLGCGLSLLVLAMLVLLRRNLIAVQTEFSVASDAFGAFKFSPTEVANSYRRLRYHDIAGFVLSAFGILILLGEVWLILI
jgi:hypothetical protein